MKKSLIMLLAMLSMVTVCNDLDVHGDNDQQEYYVCDDDMRAFGDSAADIEIEVKVPTYYDYARLGLYACYYYTIEKPASLCWYYIGQLYKKNSYDDSSNTK